MEILIELSSNSKANFLNTAWFGTILGFLGSLIVIYIKWKLDNINRKKEDIKNLFFLLMQNNSELIFYINQASQKSIDDRLISKLKKYMKNSSFFIILPEDIKSDFRELYNYLYKGKPSEEKDKIKIKCKKIIEELDKYGEDSFGFK